MKKLLLAIILTLCSCKNIDLEPTASTNEIVEEEFSKVSPDEETSTSEVEVEEQGETSSENTTLIDQSPIQSSSDSKFFLANFESEDYQQFLTNSIKVDQYGEYFLWMQNPRAGVTKYVPSGSLDRPGSVALTTEDSYYGNFSIKGIADGPTGNIFLDFLPTTTDGWHNLSDYTESTKSWKKDNYNRMRFWVKLPVGTKKSTVKQHNFHVGTYVRGENGTAQGEESDGGGHYYHYYNLEYTGQWHQVIVDTHPNHRRGGNGAIDWGNLQYPTSQPGHNYFDAMNRFYFAAKFEMEAHHYPATYFFDGFELYNQSQQESEDIYSIHGTYVPNTNEIIVGWSRVKENSKNHRYTIRYSFENIHETENGWSLATEVPGASSLAPPGQGGYNGMEFKTSSIELSGKTSIFLGIKRVGASNNLFKQIEIPINK